MEKYESRISKLQHRMGAEKIDLVVLGPGSHTRWLLGFGPHADERPCLTCISQERGAMLMPFLNADGCRSKTNLDFFDWRDEQGPSQAFKELLNAISANKAVTVAIDETMRADFAMLVQENLPGAKIQFTESTIGYLRQEKDEYEYSCLKENALIADRAMRAGWESLREGISELEVASAIQNEFTNQGAKPLFCIIGSGENSAIPHHKTGERKLARGDVVVMDIGGGLNGYSSDITRMAVVSEAPNEYKEVCSVVASASQAALETLRPGVVAKEVDAAARGVISDAGYGEYFIHRTGHGLGLEIHEPPYITSTSESVLEAGMVFSIEPGIYIPGRFGVRLEDIVILRDAGPEILSELSKETKVVQ